MRVARSWTVVTMLLPLLAWAAPAPSEPAEPEAQAEAAGEAQEPRFHWRPGPAQVDLGHELKLDVPAEHLFLEKGDAAKLMEANGSFYNDNLLGVVTAADENSSWIVVIRYEEEGYIKDDEELDAKELLEAIREGTEEANKERVERGFAALTVGEWSEVPHYDRARHHLVWALNATSTNGTSVNYSTRVLGRRGYVSMNLVVGPEELAAGKPEVARLLQSLNFNPGSRYEDFQEGTDKVAEFGLAGLVLGGAGMGAAKLVKVGLMAKLWKVILAVLLAGKKLFLVLGVALVAGLRKLFGGKEEAPPEPPPSSTPGE